MRTPDTPYAEWTRESTYPRFSFVDGQLATVDRFYVAAGDFDHSQMLDLASLRFADLTVSASNATPDVNAGKVYVTITYTRPSAFGASIIQDGEPEYTLEDGGQEIPIDKRKRDGSFVLANYLTNWNYHLAAHHDAGSVVPGWWATATTLVAAANYQWIKQPDSIDPENWEVLKVKTKNAEFVLQPSPVVVERRRYRSYNQAVGAKVTPGTRVTPGKTFDYTGEWLVVSSNITPEGRRWVATIRYQNAPEWDSDIYA